MKHVQTHSEFVKTERIEDVDEEEEEEETSEMVQQQQQNDGEIPVKVEVEEVLV